MGTERTITTNGVGKAYGLEAFLQKKEGRLTGWLAYTLAWNKRRFDAINGGRWFYGNFDRRHTINLTGNYKLGSAVSVAANWQFYTGQPTTVPVATIQRQYGQWPELVYGDRNNFRFPVNHRLDVSISWERERVKRGHRLKVWTLGAYNAYNQANPYYLEINPQHYRKNMDFTIDDMYVGMKYTLRQVSLIPVLPYVSYSVKL